MFTTQSPQPSPSPTNLRRAATRKVAPQVRPAQNSPLSQPGTTLISKTTGVDYTRLRDLLAEEKWKEADIETEKVML